MQALVAGASLAALGILIFAVSKKKVKNKTVLHLVLVAGDYIMLHEKSTQLSEWSRCI